MRVLDYETPATLPVVDPGLDVFVLARTTESLRLLNEALTRVGQLEPRGTIAAGPRPLADNADALRADLVIVELNRPEEDTLEDLRRFVEAGGQHCEVFAVVSDPDLALLRRLVRCGVRDVLPQPVPPQELAMALSRAAARKGRTPEKQVVRQGEVVAFMSAGGGMGASQLAVDVAWQLAARLRKRCALVDLDLQFGPVATELDLAPDLGLLDALRHPERIDNVYLEALLTRHASGLSVLASPGDLVAHPEIGAHAVNRLLTTLGASHEHVIVNLPACLDGAVEQVLRLAGPACLVVGDTLSTLRNLRVLLQHLSQRGIPAENLAVVHHRMDRKLKDVRGDDLLKLAGNLPLHVINGDYGMTARAENEGRAVSELYPGSRMAKDVHVLAVTVAGMAENKKKTDRPKLFGLFR